MTKPLLILLLCGTVSQALELQATKPHTGTIHRWITLPANFVPWQQVALKARVAGYVKSVAVDKGDTVTAGQKLIEIEVPELQADLIKHRAEVTVAEVEAKRLHEARAKSPDLVLAQAVDDAEAKLAIAKANMERATTLLEFAQIKAPFAGTISARQVDPGAYSAAGGDTLLQVVDAETLRLQIPVVEVETLSLQIGQMVDATIEAVADLTVHAKISRISGTLDPITRTMLIEADVKNKHHLLRPGMFATARIALEHHDGAMLVPIAALVKEKANQFVFLFVDGKAKKTAIKAGFNDGHDVEVLSGITADSVVLLPDKVTLNPDQPVTIKP